MRPRVADADIPHHLVGREVATRAVGPPWEAARKRGISPEALVAGTGCTVEQLHARSERISWASFATFLGNVGRALDDEELVAAGIAAFESPYLRAVFLPGRLISSLPEVYVWGTKPGGPVEQTFAAQRMSVTRLAEDRLRIEARMLGGYASVREHWLISRGAIRGIARSFARESEVTLTLLEDGAEYDVRFVPPRRVVERLRRTASFLFAVHDAADDLRRANDELHERYAKLQSEMEARVRAETALRELNDQLERRVAERTSALVSANRELEMFAASAAHDLRTPLRAINGFALALLEDHGEELDDRARSHVDRIVTSAIRMGELIDTLLALTRLARLTPARRQVDIARLTEEIIGRLQAAEPGRAVDLTLSGDLVADADPSMLLSLMQNLLGNAWKFTARNDPAHIRVERVAGSALPVFCVRDDGVGFDVRLARKLFQPFHRFHSKGEFAGDGVGLATAERIVRCHHGRIWAESEPGKGASFFFTLQAASAEPAEGDGEG